MPVEPERKKRRRKDEEPEQTEGSTETVEEEPDPDGAPELDEQARRAIAAEAAFRERVALQELAERLPGRSVAEVNEALEQLPGKWSLERGRHVFSRLVGEREITIDEQPVDVEHRISLIRDTAPPAEPEAVERKLVELFEPDAPPEENVTKLEPLCDELAEGDEIRIDIPGGDPIIVTSESVEQEQPTLPERTSVTTPDPVIVEQAVAETIVEPLEKPEPEPKAETPIRRTVSVLEEHAVDLNELPTIAGAAPEADEPAPEGAPEGEEPFFPEELELPEEAIELPETEMTEPPPPAPAPEQNRPKRSPRRKSPEVIIWEPGWPEAIHGPDAALKKKARKLIRRLAAEYHIRLTPDLEAYLLAILLRPGVVNGRKVYSLGFNVETVIRIMGVLATGGYARPRS